MASNHYAVYNYFCMSQNKSVVVLDSSVPVTPLLTLKPNERESAVNTTLDGRTYPC